jgi:hypothetical protein
MISGVGLRSRPQYCDADTNQRKRHGPGSFCTELVLAQDDGIAAPVDEISKYFSRTKALQLSVYIASA